MASPLPVIQPGIGLPGIERPLDNTALNAYSACPREYWFSMVHHRRGSGSLSPALAFGKGWHKALETRYRGGDRDTVEFIVRSTWEEHGAEGDYRTLERVILDYKRYCEKWGDKPEQEQGRTIGYPEEPMVEIATDSMGLGLLHPWAGKIDRIIELGGLIYVEDHKTTSRLDKHYYKGFELSNQMMGYTYLAQQLMPGEKIAGVRINLLHALKEKSNFERQLFTYTREQISEWVDNTNRWMERVSRDSVAWQEYDTLNPINQVREQWPLAHFGDNGCSRKYGLCSYHTACSVAAPFRHRVLEEFPINPWNPLEMDD